MKIGKLSLSIVLGIVLLISCSKEEDDLISQNCEADCTEIVGRIMTDNGTVPIPNLKITVTWDNIPYLGSGTIRTKATTRTDSEGNYYLKFYLRDDELNEGGHRMFYDELNNDVFLRADLNGISLFQINRDTTLTINHNVPKKAFLNLSLLNLNQIQQGNSFITEFSYPRPFEFSQSVDGQVRGWNSESDQNHLIEIAGNQPIELKIYRTVNNVLTTEIETLFFDAGTTSSYTIDFNN
jgi:hypothetical protein